MPGDRVLLQLVKSDGRRWALGAEVCVEMPLCASRRLLRAPALQEVVVLHQPAEIPERHLAGIRGVPPLLLLAQTRRRKRTAMVLSVLLLDLWMTRPLWLY
jgi:hypothetical protein